MKKRIVAIDVGTTKICTVIGDVSEGGSVRVAGVGLNPSKGLHKGLVVNIDDARDSIRESVQRAEKASGYKIESAFIGVTGRHVISNNNKGVVAITRNDRLVRADDLKRVLSVSQNVKLPNDRRLLHVIPRSYAIDGETGVKNPVGMHGFRLDVETHVISAAVSSVQNLVKCVRGIGIEIDDLVLEPLASSEAVLTPDEKQVGVILADIGGGTTDIAVFKDGSIWHTAIIPVAGYQLTRDISIGLGLPFDVAEEMKKTHGTVMPIHEGKAELPPGVSENGHGVSYQDMCDILRARVEEIVRLIMLELPRAEFETLVPAGLVLTGGSSNLYGMDGLARDIMGVPVRIGVPFDMNGISDSLRNPAYATAVGLLIWGAKNQGSNNWKPRGFGGGLRRLMSRFTGLFR